MLRRTILVVVALVGLMTVAVGTALGTPPSGFTAETARGPLVDRPLDASMHFGPAVWAKLETKGPIDVAQQRIVISPGGTLGWHSHPGPTIVTIFSGTLSFYHAEHCSDRIAYSAGQSFSNLPDEIHLARNESATDNVVLYATYYVPSSTGGLRIEQPSPGVGCPQ